MPIDINLLRDEKGGNVAAVKESQRKRFASVELVDEVVALDKQWRETIFRMDGLNAEKRKKSKAIGEKKKKGEDAEEEQKAVREMTESITQIEKEVAHLEKERDKKLAEIGNIVPDDVVVSDNEANNKVMWTYGECKSNEGKYHHHEVLSLIDGYEPERGVAVAGHRGYFLKGPAVLLNQALINYSLHFLTARGYTALQPPYFMNKEVMAGVAQLSQYDEELYHVEGEKGEEKYLIATSEQPICGYHLNEWIDPATLPRKYAGFSSCFRKEAGAHGKDTWGIFRVHQFDKVEQFTVTDPESSWAMHEQMIAISREFYESLKLPYRVISIVSGALNNAAAKKYDLEGWFPAYQEYRELVSCSNCLDYQSRATNTRFGHKKADEKDKKYVHMLNSTLCALTRTICAILENYQTPEGVVVPEVLVGFMGGMTFIPFVKDISTIVREK